MILGILGSGSFAKVFRVKDKTSRCISALKVIEKAALTQRAEENLHGRVGVSSKARWHTWIFAAGGELSRLGETTIF
jgi:hypothetical protein